VAIDSRGESIRVVHPLFPVEGGGSIPTSPLQLHVGEIHVTRAIQLNAIWHSRLPNVVRGNIDRNTHSVCFGAEYAGNFYASAIWSSPVAGNRLSSDGTIWLELRRFAIASDAPKNTASRVMAIMVRLLRVKFPDVTRLISYHDTDVHSGTIYKAAGWTATKKVTDSNWGVRSSGRGRKRAPPVAPGIKVRWELAL